MHAQRVIVALIAVPLFYLAIAKLPALVFLFLLMFFGSIALHEFYALCGVRGSDAALGLVCGVFLYVPWAFSFHEAMSMQVFLFAAAFIFLATARLFVRRNPEGSRAELSLLMMGLVYVPGLLIPQWLLRLEAVEWIYFLYLCVWASDTTAYYLGKNFGKHKLYPTVSPKKTVEGAVGSVIGGGLAATLCWCWFFPLVSLPYLLFLGLVTGAVTIVGDLVESMFKRDANIKDSSGLIPGHGGVLDRLDSVLFAGPVLYIMQRVFA